MQIHGCDEPSLIKCLGWQDQVHVKCAPDTPRQGEPSSQLNTSRPQQRYRSTRNRCGKLISRRGFAKNAWHLCRMLRTFRILHSSDCDFVAGQGLKVRVSCSTESGPVVQPGMPSIRWAKERPVCKLFDQATGRSRVRIPPGPPKHLILGTVSDAYGNLGQSPKYRGGLLQNYYGWSCVKNRHRESVSDIGKWEVNYGLGPLEFYGSH